LERAIDWLRHGAAQINHQGCNNSPALASIDHDHQSTVDRIMYPGECPMKTATSHAPARRRALKHLAVCISSATLLFFSKTSLAAATLQKSRAEWRKLLPRESYQVLFEEDTEAPGSSALNSEKRKGTFICAACFLPLFDSAAKFDSGTGWPSFFDVLPGAIGKRDDTRFFMTRTEYHCARCGGHQGHVFDDGPPPTGLRYCNNGLALQFVSAESELPELRS
jgi:peptide-methionine (R)-S-oxide reductase